MLHRVGVISDTHLPRFTSIPEVVWDHFAGVELIIHAGDISMLNVLRTLETIAPVEAVQGNVEHEEVVLKLPIKREIRIGQCRIGIVHILGEARSYTQTARREFPAARIVVFGHSHIPYNQDSDGQVREQLGLLNATFSASTQKLRQSAKNTQDSGASMVALYKAMSKQAKDVAAFIDKQIPELEKLYEPVGKLYAAYQGALDAYTKFMEQWKGKLPESDFSGRALELVQTEIEKSLR